jgi:hypothetical protein
LTVWSLRTNAVSADLGVTNPTTATVIPTVGDLMVVSSSIYIATTVPTSGAVTDTGSGGWTLIGFQRYTGNPYLGLGCWFKVAASADNNSGAGITVTVTFAGGAGTVYHSIAEVDCFALSTGGPPLGDLTGGTSGYGSSTLTFSAAAGSSYPTNSDALAWGAWGGNAGAGGLGTPSNFAGTSTAKALNLINATHDSFLSNGYVTAVQGSATAATNVWNLSAGGVGIGCAIGATFVATTFTPPPPYHPTYLPPSSYVPSFESVL